MCIVGSQEWDSQVFLTNTMENVGENVVAYWFLKAQIRGLEHANKGSAASNSQ